MVRVEFGKARCRFHGGLSTGPKTETGRRRIAEAQRRRWRVYHERTEFASSERAAMAQGTPMVRRASVISFRRAAVKRIVPSGR